MYAVGFGRGLALKVVGDMLDLDMECALRPPALHCADIPVIRCPMLERYVRFKLGRVEIYVERLCSAPKQQPDIIAGGAEENGRFLYFRDRAGPMAENVAIGCLYGLIPRREALPRQECRIFCTGCAIRISPLGDDVRAP